MLFAAAILLFVTGCAPPKPAPPPASHTFPKNFLAQAISFWSAEDGVVSGSSWAGSTDTVVVATTTDGGRVWTIRLRLSVPSFVGGTFVTSSVPQRGWVTYETCIKKDGYPYRNCTIHALETTDGGRTWVYGGPKSQAFSFVGGTGWAIIPSGAYFAREGLYRLTLARSGRLKETYTATPCTGQLLGPGQTPAAVAAMGPRRAVLLCYGSERPMEPQGFAQAKAIYTTKDSGRTWVKVLGVPVDATKPVGGLSAAGLAYGVTFLPDGHGWLWPPQGALYSTKDGGRTWAFANLPSQLVLEVTDSASFVNDRVGYALVQDLGSFALMVTKDGGETWTQLRDWGRKPAGHR